jgi:hypothetical protein
MIEQSLVYIHSVKPTRRFVGCGTLVEGGYVATCRHVWRMATETVARDQLGAPLTVEIEYPYSREATVRSSAKLADACDSAPGLAPDLVLLLPDAIPSGMLTLQLAADNRFEIGDSYALAGLRGLDKNNPQVLRVVRIEGGIADHIGTDGLRQFTGTSQEGFWSERGSSGSPVFLRHGQQLAGILSLSMLGANDGASQIKEAFIVPGTTIRSHAVRLAAAPVVRAQHIDAAELKSVLGALGEQDVPVAEIPERLRRFIEAARAHADKPVRETNDGADIDAVISATRSKLRSLDTEGARKLLQTKIDEEEEARLSRIVPLLKERAAVERLAFDYEAAKSTLTEITRLVPDDTQAWIDLGDVWIRTEAAND